jgi:hypothetical protein
MSRSTYPAILKRRKILKLKKNYERRAITPRWVIKFTSKLPGR